MSFIDHTPVRLAHAPCELTEIFGHALRIVLLSQNARGAICARSLTSKLADSASLDYRKHAERRANAHGESVVTIKFVGTGVLDCP